ncbi:hormogonium polysaccharide secretion pseudopilin HpsB [Halotia wernerae UHCC 0503]|nr:hormogonium polysaccharide secretion pseudopilin HpsB [Halotia wernerae UHCC 0503]
MNIGKQANKQRLQTVEVGKTSVPYLQHGESGFTIVESLVAILVVGILLAAIAPVIALSVATRVQSRRVELATQAARSYIDAVRTQKILATAGPTTDTALVAATAPTTTGTLTCIANSYCTDPTAPTGTSLYCVDFDGSGSCESTSVADMVVQAFRPNNNDATKGYALGIRVYRADAFKASITLLKNTSTTKTTQNTFAAGGGGKKAPLVEMTTDISDIVPKYSDLCARFSGCS